MQDRVAEVLAERATLDNGAAAGLALSVALHAGITAVVIYAALHHPAPEMSNVLNIKFAPVQQTAPLTVPVAPPAVPGVANPNDITAGTSGVTGLEGGDFPYTIYIDRMRNLIGTHWFRPQGTTAAATVHFVINRDGSIRDVTLDTSSGNGTFDRAAQRAVVEASPLPPLPFAYSGTYLGVHLTFR